jgi:hypothetical protein
MAVSTAHLQATHEQWVAQVTAASEGLSSQPLRSWRPHLVSPRRARPPQPACSSPANERRVPRCELSPSAAKMPVIVRHLQGLLAGLTEYAHRPRRTLSTSHVGWRVAMIVGIAAVALGNGSAGAADIRQSVAVPSLTNISATTQTARLFTVTGKDFTAGGRVYLAIYDQMGAQLYETRWITANLPLLALMGPTGHEAASLPGSGRGGMLHEAFANLCGATAMMRAYDLETDTWSTWLTVEPACAAYVEPRNGPR